MKELESAWLIFPYFDGAYQRQNSYHIRVDKTATTSNNHKTGNELLALPL
jgi:hypothetical protein